MDRQLLQAILNESNSVGISFFFFFPKGMKYLFVRTLVSQKTFVHVLIWMSDNLTILITMLQWVELCPCHPHHRFVRVLTPSISDCDLIWKQGLYRCNQVKMRSLGWVLIHYEQHPYPKGSWTQTCAQKNAMWRWRQKGKWRGRSQGAPKKARNPSETRRDTGQILLHTPGAINPADTLS